VTEDVLPNRSVTEEDALPVASAMEEEWARNEEAMKQEPMDETMLFYAYEEVGGPPPQSEEEMAGGVLTENANLDAEQQGPEPIHLERAEHSNATEEGESETETVKFLRPDTGGRKRSKAGRGRPEGQRDATKDAPETL
jgi:hypothetical protein